MTVKVTLTATLDADWWGWPDWLADMKGWSVEDIHAALIQDVIMDDFSAVVEEGTWTIEITDEPEYQPGAAGE